MWSIAALGALSAAAVAALLFAGVAYRKCPPDQVLVVTGAGKSRFVIGNSAVVMPLLQRVDRLHLGNVQTILETDSTIYTYDAIGIDAKAVANFQISIDPELIKVAARNYLNQSKDRMEQDVREVLLGKMREVIGQTSIVDLMQNRDAFNQKVFENARDDMAALGLELVTFNVQDFTDHQHVIENMGADQANQVRKAAQFARIEADKEVAARQNELDLKEAELKKSSDAAKAEAEMVFATVTAQRQLELNVARQNAEIAAEEKRIELAEKAVAVKERELDATVRKKAEADRFAAGQKADACLYVRQKEAEASLYEKQKAAEAALYEKQQQAAATQVDATARAEALVSMSKAEAESVRIKGEAEGAAEQARGEGLAEAARRQVEAYSGADVSGFLAERYIAAMPELARAVASPLSAVDSITMYGEGNAGALVGETSRMVSQVDGALSDALGIDIKSLIGATMAGKAAGSAMADAAAAQQAEEAVAR